MKLSIATITLAALIAPLALAGPTKYPVKKEAVNPDYENGQLWDGEFLQKNQDTYMGWCRSAQEHGTKVTVDYKSFEDGFDYEMTHKKKVRDRSETITPWNACDHLCGFISLEGNLMISDFPSDQDKPALAELRSKVTNLKCVYKNPDNKTHLEYDAKTKTLTGVMTWGGGSDWSGWAWATSAFETPAMKKEFPVITKWKESH